MPPKKYSKTPKNVSSQGQVKSTVLSEKNGSKKNLHEESKPFKVSRNSSVSSGLGGGSPRKRISPKKESMLPKSVIKEKPSASPAKGWGELAGFSELRDLIAQELIPPHEDKSIEYQSEFPALGETIETPKSNMLSSLEILHPPSNAQKQLHRNNMDHSPSRKNKEGESLVSEEKVVEYESHFPSLGAELDETKEAESEFNPEILEAEKKVALETQNVEPVNIVEFLSHEEDIKEKSTHKRDLDKETHGDLLKKGQDLDLKSDNVEVMKKILDKNLHLKHTELAPPPKDDTWDKTLITNQNYVQTLTPTEKANEYECHFPALGAEPESNKHAETEFSRDILEAEEKFAVEAEKVEPVNIINVHEERFEERIVEVTFTRTIEEKEKKKFVRSLPRDELEERLSEEKLRIPLDELPSEVLHDEQEEVMTPRNSEVDEYEQFVLRIPLELVPDFVEDEPDVVYSPTNKRIKFLGQINVFGHNSPNVSKAEIERNPQTFTEAVELFLQREEITIPLDLAPEFIDEESTSPSNRRIKRLGQISVWGGNSPNVSRIEMEREPQTFSEAVKIFLEPSVEDVEEKLASELEQEEQVLDFLQQGSERKYRGEEQRDKQSKQIEEAEMSSSLQRSWDIIQGKEEEVEKKSYEGYKLVKPKIGDVEENERLLSKQQEDFIQEEEEAEFGSYKVAGTRAKSPLKTEQVEIKEESIRKVPQEPELQAIEENIVGLEEKDEGVNLRDVLSKDIKEIEKKESRESPLNRSKGGGEKSSLEHIVEEPTMAFTNQSDLTLSANRIDLIKEELNALLNSPKDNFFREIEKNFQRVKDLEKAGMYGAAINLLKKSLETLDARLVKHDDFDIDKMNKFLIRCNNELAHCFAQVQEYRESVDYARAALNLESGNVKAIYYLGTGLNKIGDPLGGYDVLKDVKRLTPPEEESEYFTLINMELDKFERKIEEGERKQLKLESPLVKNLPLTKLSQQYPSYTKKVPTEKGSSVLSNIGIFAGSAGVSGAATWFISKDYFKLSEKKSLMYSLGIGAVIGGISLAIFGGGSGKRKSKK